MNFVYIFLGNLESYHWPRCIFWSCCVL